MYDRGLFILEQYGLEPISTKKGRGILLYETADGWISISEYGGTKQKLELQEVLMEHLAQTGFFCLDRMKRTSAGELLSHDREENNYIVREWHAGRECDVRSVTDIERAAGTLANLHNHMHMEVQKEYEKESLIEECSRHNAQIKKVKRLILKRKRKNLFEVNVLSCVDCFLEQALETTARLRESQYLALREKSLEAGEVCHGEYTQHHVLFSGNLTMVTNFEHWNFDSQIADLYQFMRKILEKHNWDLAIGTGILETYQKVRPLSQAELCHLKLRLSYPWKFWKLLNYYASNNKVWISGKNVEKLRQIQTQIPYWTNFLKNGF
ncbi:MAG: hypothetical protein PHG16_09665 [Lachnospiraceae bacterium]|nr:hypothetical protein [Lachnospiraceae bacterium]